MSETATDVILCLADISGYTSFMKRNVETLVHSQVVITRLLESILDRIVPPWEVSKLEGDAVFFYCVKPVPEGAPGEARRAAAALVAGLREAFHRTVAELARSRYCDCDACRGIEHLRVKVIAHSGRAVIHRVRRFEELAGVDVILVHRLLKNSVDAQEYVLLTEAASGDMDPPEGFLCRTMVERCEGLGEVSVRAYLPPVVGAAPELAAWPRLPLGRRILQRTRWTWNILRAELLVRLGLRRRPDYRNVPPAGTPAWTDRLFGLVMLLVFPLQFPLTVAQNALELFGEPPPGESPDKEQSP